LIAFFLIFKYVDGFHSCLFRFVRSSVSYMVDSPAVQTGVFALVVEFACVCLHRERPAWGRDIIPAASAELVLNKLHKPGRAVKLLDWCGNH